MNLKDEKSSRYLIDNTWAPYTRDEGWKWGGIYLPEKSSSSTSLNSPDPFQLDYYEREMLKSGANIREILFNRLLNSDKGEHMLHRNKRN